MLAASDKTALSLNSIPKREGKALNIFSLAAFMLSVLKGLPAQGECCQVMDVMRKIVVGRVRV